MPDIQAQDTASVITDPVRRWAKLRPNATAIVDTSQPTTRALTWRELSRQGDRIAELLTRLGVRPGETVVTKLPNWHEAVVIGLGVLRAKAVLCSLLPTLGPRETTQVLQRARPRVLCLTRAEHQSGTSVEHVLVVDREQDVDVACASPQCGTGHRYSQAILNDEAVSPANEILMPDFGGYGQLAFTSGTSGDAKPILHYTRTLVSAAQLAADRLRLTDTDRIFVPAPLSHHSGSLYGMWLSWVIGCRQILQGRWDPTKALATLREQQGTMMQVAPPMLVDLGAEITGGAEAPSSLRLVVVTGAAVRPSLVENARNQLGARVCRAWGSTETCMGTLGEPDDSPGRLAASDGRPLAGVRLRITDHDGSELPADRQGQLEIDGQCVFDGYGSRPPFDRNTFTADGWHRTGDVAMIDQQGCLHITGRRTDVINRGGLKIPTTPIEAVLAEHEAVADVAVVPVADERLGERICALVVLAAGQQVDLPDLQRHLARNGVTKHYWPEFLTFTDRLTRNAAGKLRRSELRHQVLSPIAEGGADDAR